MELRDHLHLHSTNKKANIFNTKANTGVRNLKFTDSPDSQMKSLKEQERPLKRNGKAVMKCCRN